jgi:hypothetical protein
MSTDGQGRPLSDDGQWAWTGTEWVPAALSSGPSPVQPVDPNTTIIGPSPFAAGGAPEAGQAGYGSASIANKPEQVYGGPKPVGYGATPAGYGATPAGYGATPPGYGAAPAGYGAPPPPTRSRKPLFIGIAVVVVLVAVAVVLIVTLTGSKKSDPSGAYVCTVPGTPETGTVTFTPGKNYTLSDQGKPGTYTKKSNTLTFKDGGLDKAVGTYDKNAKTVKITLKGVTLTCKG